MEASIIKTRKNKDYANCVVVTVRCPHCKKTHTHGSSAQSNVPEHRVADCHKGTYTFKLTSR